MRLDSCPSLLSELTPFPAFVFLVRVCDRFEAECVAGFAGNLSATLVQYNLATEEIAASQALSAAQQLGLVIQAFASWG